MVALDSLTCPRAFFATLTAFLKLVPWYILSNRCELLKCVILITSHSHTPNKDFFFVILISCFILYRFHYLNAFEQVTSFGPFREYLGFVFCFKISILVNWRNCFEASICFHNNNYGPLLF